MLRGQEAWRSQAQISLAENGRNQTNHKSYKYLAGKGRGLSRIYPLWLLLLYYLYTLKMLKS